MEQGSLEWFEDRSGKVNCSMLEVVLAKGKGDTLSKTREDYMWDILCELKGASIEDSFKSKDMILGKENEIIAKEAYQNKTGYWLDDNPGKCHRDIPLWRGSPDGLISDCKGGIEVKCPKARNHMQTKYNKKPIALAYILQMTGIVEIFELEWIDFVSYCPRLPSPYDLYIRRFTRSELPIDEVRAGVIQFLKDLDELESRVRSIGG